MAYHLDAGALRSKIQIFDQPTGEAAYDDEGYPLQALQNVFGEGKQVWCRWVNLFGSDVLTARQLGVEEGATVTMRYSPKVTPTCEIRKGADPRPYEVISINDIEDRHVWLELKVQRKVQAKAVAQ